MQARSGQFAFHLMTEDQYSSALSFMADFYIKIASSAQKRWMRRSSVKFNEAADSDKMK